MKTNEANKNKKFVQTGWIIFGIGLILLVISDRLKTQWNDFFIGNPIFFVYYPMCLIYFLLGFLTVNPSFKFKLMSRKVFILSASCFFISSFILNHSMQLFSPFTLYTKIYISVLLLTFLAFAYLDLFKKPLRYLVLFFSGSGIVLALYLSMYLTEAYGVGIIASFVLGISIHVFSPLIILVTMLVLFVQLEKKMIDKLAFFSGIALPVFITILFLVKWDRVNREIHKTTASLITRPENELDNWILLAQQISDDPFTQKIIKGAMVYDTFREFWWGTRSFFDETKKHDPLVNVGMALMGDLNLDRDQRIQILRSHYNARHQTQRKLWSGRNLGVTQVLSNIRIYPEYRLAYTEKIVEIKNFSTWERNRQEAAFTFYLPEGSVATSLSLWINGKEEKSRLTTKGKADSAYVRVVGVEHRDPAVLHWQEGNTLTVTVFPCTPAENRKFKIGITSPMFLQDNVLTLQSIYFDGPTLTNAMETTVLKFESDHNVQNIVLPKGFFKQPDKNYQYNGKCMPYYEISCNAPQLSKKAFPFNGNTYFLKQRSPKTSNFSPKTIYVDLNKSWTFLEFKALVEMFSDKKVYTFHDNLIEVDIENASDVFNLFKVKNFSLFPLNVITGPENSLLVSKSTELSPNLSDLKNTTFGGKLEQYLKNHKERINIFQIGSTTSPYLKTLKEFQVFNFKMGNLEDLTDILNRKQFPLLNTVENETDIDIAGVTVVKSNNTSGSDAPDHLLRLFNYNNILKKMGKKYFNKSIAFSDEVVQLANEGYLVSPVSSLIVLESQQDYKRFGIDENKNSLKNASINSSGAVPEPHEWVLIGMMLLFLTWITLKRFLHLKGLVFRLKR